MQKGNFHQKLSYKVLSPQRQYLITFTITTITINLLCCPLSMILEKEHPLSEDSHQRGQRKSRLPWR